ncbi:glycosyltransferase family 4 protein [Maribacter algicola]|uniref:Glycosyltransferase family 4 protein n=1 Tax=Meishania litoralis TaxID=3434685 RepID=A0ACC7LMI8_9FLAO
MKNIWFINQYISSPDIEGDGYRHYYIAKNLAKNGYRTTLITSSFAHAPYRHNKIKGLFKLVNTEIKTLILKGNVYSGNGIGRIMSWVWFSLGLLIVPFISKKKIQAPDVIVLSSLPILPILNIVLMKWLFYPKAKFIFEVRDLWPLSVIELGNYGEKNIFIRFLSYLEKLSYKKADLIISVIPKADLHIREVLGHANFNFKWITNGFEIPERTVKLNLADVLDIDISKSNFNIAYAGTLVTANPLDTIIEVVGNHNDRRVQLYILGWGPEKDRIIELSKNYDNIHLHDRIPKKYVTEFLSRMDLLFMGKGTKESTIYKFGTSQLKTFDYFYAGKPIIQALNSKENPVTYAKAGYVVQPENEEELLERIDYFLNLDITARREYGNRGHKYLMENCTYKQISVEFQKCIEKLL